MQRRTIGQLSVSAVGVGCWNFGRTLDEQQSAEVVTTALDEGVDFFDVSSNYGKGFAEEFLGKAVAGRRESVVIATKFGASRGWGHRTPLGYRDNAGGGDPAYLRESLHASLRRLGTDYVDLLQMHDPDPTTPIEETLDALNDLVKAGLVREVGCSNFTGDQLEQAKTTAHDHNTVAFSSVQNHYSVLHQVARAEVLGFCRNTGARLLPYFPLANGLLTGKYQPGMPTPADSRIGKFLEEGRPDKAERFHNPRNLQRIARLAEYAESRNRSLIELAFGWLLTHPEIPSIIAGASTPQQVKQNAAAVDWRLTTQELDSVDRLLADGEPLTCQP